MQSELFETLSINELFAASSKASVTAIRWLCLTTWITRALSIIRRTIIWIWLSWWRLIFQLRLKSIRIWTASIWTDELFIYIIFFNLLFQIFIIFILSLIRILLRPFLVLIFRLFQIVHLYIYIIISYYLLSLWI